MRRRFLVAMVLTAAVASSAATLAGGAVRPQAHDGAIAFVSGDCRANSCRIWLMNADGSHLRPLTGAATNDSQPSFSPNGNHVVFTRREHGRDEIWVMNADGTGQRALTHTVSGASHPQFSPDGRTILLQDEHLSRTCLIACGPTRIAVMNANGAHERLLTHAGRYDSEPSYSPDGKTIVYTRWAGNKSTLTIWLMHADGSQQRPITHDRIRDGQARFSPDGNSIVFRSDRTGQSQIWLMHADGTHQRRLSHDQASDNEPYFSPDGKHILFESNRSGTYQIWTMNTDGADPHQLTRGPDQHTEAQWAPR
jgi:Tol biopolymer transport system component